MNIYSDKVENHLCKCEKKQKLFHILNFTFEKIKNVGWNFCVRLTLGSLLMSRQSSFRHRFLSHVTSSARTVASSARRWALLSGAAAILPHYPCTLLPPLLPRAQLLLLPSPQPPPLLPRHLCASSHRSLFRRRSSSHVTSSACA